MNLPYLMTAQEVCDLLRISRQTLWRLGKKNTNFPAPRKVGAKDFYLGESIKNYFEKEEGSE